MSSVIVNLLTYFTYASYNFVTFESKMIDCTYLLPPLVPTKKGSCKYLIFFLRIGILGWESVMISEDFF